MIHQLLFDKQSAEPTLTNIQRNQYRKISSGIDNCWN